MCCGICVVEFVLGEFVLGEFVLGEFVLRHLCYGICLGNLCCVLGIVFSVYMCMYVVMHTCMSWGLCVFIFLSGVCVCVRC